MKKNLLIVLMLVFANICFAQTINLRGSLYSIDPKVEYLGNITAEWNVVEYAGQRYTMLSFPNPAGGDGWGDIIFAGGIWEVITDPYKYWSNMKSDGITLLKSFIVHDPGNYNRCITVDWLRDNDTDQTQVMIQLCHVTEKGSYHGHHKLIIKDNANMVFASDIMGLLESAVKRGILTQKIMK